MNLHKPLLMESVLLFFIGAIALFALPAWSGIDVLQSRYDLYRTGANTHETILNTSNVNVENFGLLFSYPVDGDIYAQPLYVSNLDIPGKGLRNVVYVATMNDVIYAFDADSTADADDGLIWVRDFRNPSEHIIPAQVAVSSANRNIRRNMGIEGTPIINKASQTLYLLARTRENGNAVQRLHALDLITGQEKPGSPVTIAGTYKGITFDPKIQNQRAGLALASNQVIIAWGSDSPEFILPVHGWVMSYDAVSLSQTGVFAATTTVTGGGIWASGRAPAVIKNSVGGQDVILFTGNAINVANKPGYDGVTNFPESMLRLRIDPKNILHPINLVDWFTPDNWEYLDQRDMDLGGSGPVILPNSGYIVGGGKQGIMYVVDPENMGKMQKGNPNLIQSFRAVSVLHIMGGGVVWDRSSIGKPLLFYNWGESDRLKAFSFDGHQFDTQNVVVGKEIIQGHPGGILTLSADGTSPGSGIVWSWGSNKGSAVRSVKQGILRAYDAENITRLLWSSRMDTADDALAFAKFTPPTVANGKVYVATFSNKLLVYGILPKAREPHVYVSLVSRIGNKHLEVIGAGRMPGTRVQINLKKESARQHWEIKRLPNGDKVFISVVNQLLLDDGLAGIKAGIPVQVWTKRPEQQSAAQAWRVIPSTDGYVKIISRDNDYALTLSNMSGTDRTPVRTMAQNGDKMQDWKIVTRRDGGVTECNTASMQFVSALPRSRLLTAAGNEAWIEDPNGSPAQTWKMQVRSSGAYEFQSVANGLLLSSMNNSETDEASIRLTAQARTANQAWKIRLIVDPYDTFSYVTSIVGGKVLSIKDGRSENGAPVVSYTLNETLQQQWRIQDANSLWCFD